MKQFLALPKGNLLSIFALIWVALIQPVFADEPARISPDKLSLQNAVELARQKNPSLLLSAKNHKAAIAQIGASRSAFYPQLEADLTYTRATANFAPQPGLSLPGGGGSETDVSYPNYNGILTVHQLLYDFGKVNTQVRSAERLAESSEADRKSTDAVIVLNVKQAYYGLLQNMQIQGVNEETVRQLEKHLEQAEGFFAVGSKPKFDVTKARVDLNNARLNLIKAKNAVQVSRVTLNNAMGVPVDFKAELSDMMTFKKEALTLEAAQNLSLHNRPEMLSLRLKKESVRHTLENARAQYYPTLSASGSYAYRNEDFPLVHNWNIGATLAFPFFSGFLTSRQVDQAQANMEAAEAQEEIEAQTIRLEVQQAYLDMAAAEEQIAVSGLIVSQAEENLGLAEGRYRAGVGTAIETTDAEVSLSNAKTSAIQALYSHNVARAQLEKAAGGLLPEGTVK